MKRFTKMLAVGSAALAFAAPANAQLGAPHGGSGILFPANGLSTSYDHHWAPMHGEPTIFWPGKALFDAVAGPNNFAGPGDAVRICYGIDVTQGGRNASGPGSSTPGPFGDAAGNSPTGGSTENSWFRIVQGYAAVATAPGVDIGLISVQAGTTSDISGDNCFTPFNKGASNSGGHAVAGAAIGGLFTGTGVAPAPGIFWEFSFNWTGSPALIRNVIGDDSMDPGVPTAVPAVPPRGIGNPLLSNVVFEVQGPLNGPVLQFLGNQYYLSSTLEWAGVHDGALNPTLGFRGTGGVTNGNGNMGFGIFGATAGVTNAVSATRFIGTGPTGAFISLNFRILTPAVQAGTNFRAGRNEFMGSLAFNTPRSWAYHNFSSSALGTGVNFHTVGAGQNGPAGGPNAPVIEEGRDGGNGNMLVVGNGGPDWRISGAPISNVDVIAIDHQSGADVNFNVYNKVGTYAYPDLASPVSSAMPGTYNPRNAAGFPTTGLGTLGIGGYYFGIPGIPCYFATLNRMVMLWSITPSGAPMIQVPGSWDDTTFALIGVQGTKGAAGNTTREGFQSSALNIDGTTILLASKLILLFGTKYSDSDDFFADGALDYSGFPVSPGPSPVTGVPIFSSLFEGGFVPMTSGQSDLKSNGGQIPISLPSPGLAGIPLYMSLSGSHINICDGSAFEITEQYSALTIVLQ
ncbi:MAG: hypothetical protein ACI87A_000295 [Planctomycetota bacterium]|jgi:hypothetical protein